MIMMSPGVYTREQDFSTVVAGISSVIFGIVGGFKRGPLSERVLVTSGADFVKKFGEPFPDSLASYAALQYLQQGGQLWVVRVAGGDDGDEAVAASVIIKDNTTPEESATDGLEFTAATPGTWADDGGLKVKISDVDAMTSTFSVSIEYKGEVVSKYYDVHVDNVSIDPPEGTYIGDIFTSDHKYVVVEDLKEGDWGATLPKEGTYLLVGGANGIVADDGADLDGIIAADYIKGLEQFQNPDDVYINLLAVPGCSDAAVINKALEICEARGDCMFIVDPPLGLEEQEVVEWHNGAGDYSGEHQTFNSSYGALYWPWMEIYDPYNSKKIWVPPSGLVAGAYAYNDRVGEPWFAPAGLSRGRLLTPLALEINPSLPSRDFMYSGGNAVNPIVNFPQDGIAIWGQRTLQRKPSALDRVNVRRLMLLVRRAIAISTKYLIFEQNDFTTWDRWKNMVDPFLGGIMARRGLYDYRVIMDETTVTEDDIDNNRMPGKILLKPTRSAEFISIDFVLYPTGVSFDN